jgi:hypothetical protein
MLDANHRRIGRFLEQHPYFFFHGLRPTPVWANLYDYAVIHQRAIVVAFERTPDVYAFLAGRDTVTFRGEE